MLVFILKLCFTAKTLWLFAGCLRSCRGCLSAMHAALQGRSVSADRSCVALSCNNELEEQTFAEESKRMEQALENEIKSLEAGFEGLDSE